MTPFREKTKASPLRQRAGDFSQRKTRVSPSERDPCDFYQRKTRTLLPSDRDLSDFSQRKTSATPLRQWVGRLLTEKDEGVSPQTETWATSLGKTRVSPSKDLASPLRDLSDFSQWNDWESSFSETDLSDFSQERPGCLPSETWVAFPRERPGCLPLRLLPGKTRASPLIQRLKWPFSKKDHHFSLQTQTRVLPCRLRD